MGPSGPVAAPVGEGDHCLTLPLDPGGFTGSNARLQKAGILRLISGQTWTSWTTMSATSTSAAPSRRRELMSQRLTITSFPSRHSVPGLTLPSGQPAQLFSSRNAKTVRRHFRWLREHGLPGVFLQRFLSEVYQPEEGLRVVRDQVGRNVREAAEKEGRVWSVMWDLSGTPADKLEEALLEDWSHLVRTLLPLPPSAV